MLPPESLVVLDTNILVHLVRGKAAGKKLLDRYSLDKRPEQPLISRVTVGECLSLARQLGWGTNKVDHLKEILAKLVVVDIHLGGVVEAYAEMDAFAVANGRTVGKNDLWIAATTKVANAVLLTTDKDFRVFDGEHIQVEYVDPTSLRAA